MEIVDGAIACGWVISLSHWTRCPLEGHSLGRWVSVCAMIACTFEERQSFERESVGVEVMLKTAIQLVEAIGLAREADAPRYGVVQKILEHYPHRVFVGTLATISEDL